MSSWTGGWGGVLTEPVVQSCMGIAQVECKPLDQRSQCQCISLVLFRHLKVNVLPHPQS